MVYGNLIKGLPAVFLTLCGVAFVAETEMRPDNLTLQIGKGIKRVENSIVLFHMGNKLVLESTTRFRHQIPVSNKNGAFSFYGFCSRLNSAVLF